VKDVQPQVDAVIAEFLLKMLTAAGCLVESDALVTKPEFATLSPGSVFISRLSTQPDLVLNALSSAHVTVAGGGELATLTADFLIDSGVTHVERITLSQLRDNPASVVVSGVTLAVVCLDSQDFSIFDQVNEASLQTGVPWLRSMLDGPDGQVGPAVIPHQSACYRCFDSRWRSHVAEPNSYDAYRETSPAVSGGLLSSFTACVASHTAMEAVRLISRATAPSTVGHFFEFHVANPIPVGHVVLRLPRCPACKASVIARTPWGRPPAELDPGS
jgi:bacteriocin biosynthesis cyclodehydratase domain-containing protein